MSRQLTIQLLGDFRLQHGDQPITSVDTPRLQALLAYLLLHRHAPQPRQQLAFLFWPDSSETQARANLRQLLHHLRQALPNADQFLHLEAKTVQWRPTAPFSCDVITFEEHLNQAKTAAQHGQLDMERVALAAAVDCYRGDLLPACYDDWILSEREQRRGQLMTALERLSHLLEEGRDYTVAIAYAQRLLHHDPVHETTYVRLMRLYALKGDRASALRAYHTCVTVLQRELDVDPHPSTQEAYARLLNLTTTVGEEIAVPTPLVGGMRLIGRQAEWAQLQAAWQQVAQGRAHVVLVTGEAGIGKTRLVEELHHWAEQQGMTVAHTRSYAAEGDLAYAPVIEWLRSPALQAMLPQLATIWLTEVARLLPELLTQHPNLPPPTPLQERWQRQRLFEALARAVLLAKPPLLLAIDDLQWCDQETLEWLHYLLRFDPKARLLVVGTVRTEEVNEEHPLTILLPHLQRADQVTEVALSPLNAAETRLLAIQAAGQQLDSTTLERLVQFTAGNPLFVVETARIQIGAWAAALQESRAETPNIGQPSMPPKVYAVIQTRLRQLSPAARTLAGLAAVIGQAFTIALLARASSSDEETLLRGLDELWKRRIIREQGANAYDFSHDRIREVAYATNNPIQRIVQHRRIAQALEQLYVDDLDAVSVQLAVHYARAGRAEQAIHYYQRAADMERKIFSHNNAIDYLDAGLLLIKEQPRTAENKKREIALLLAKAENIEIVRGFAVAAMADICADLLLLLPHLDDDPLTFKAHQRLRGFYAAAGMMARACEHTNHLLAMAPRLADPIYQISAWQGGGVVNLQLGCFAVARQYMEQVIEMSRKNAISKQSPTLVDNLVSSILSNLTLTLWLLGYPDQARTQTIEAMVFADRIKNPLGMSIPPFYASMTYCYLGVVDATAIAAEKQLALDAQYGVPLSRASGLVAQGWVWVQHGRHGEGITQMRAGIDEMNAANHTMFQTHRLAWLAEALMYAGDWAAAAATLDEAFAMSDKSGQRSCDAELHRLRGEWLALSAVGSSKSEVRSQEAMAEAAFGQAIEVARSQQAKSFELRAVMSLCRLWQRQGKRAEARAMLAEIYGWFTEGFDTADLQAAKALLAELV